MFAAMVHFHNACGVEIAEVVIKGHVESLGAQLISIAVPEMIPHIGCPFG